VCAALGVVLLVIGLAGIWAFIEPAYKNAPDDVAPAMSTTMHLSGHSVETAWAPGYAQTGAMG
jgi:hypothetical protein